MFHWVFLLTTCCLLEVGIVLYLVLTNRMETKFINKIDECLFEHNLGALLFRELLLHLLFPTPKDSFKYMDQG